MLEPILGFQLPYVTLFPAVMVSAWLGGLGPGLLSTLLSSVGAAYLWLVPARALGVASPGGLVGLLIFWGVCFVISSMHEASRRAINSVAAAEERLQATLVGIGDGVIATDDRGRVTRVNPVAEALTGWTEAEALGRPLGEVFAIQDEHTRQPAENPVPRVLRDGRIVGLANHTLLVTRDGRETPIDDSAAPIRDADGGIAGAVLIFRDVGDRRRSERERAELLQNERVARLDAAAAADQLELALDAGRMGTWEWIIGSGLVKWSHGLESIHGLAPGTFPGTFEAVQREVHPADRERVAESIRQAVAGGLPYHVEYRIVRTDGAVRWVEGVGQVFRDANGRPNRMVGVCSDVTERKQGEEALKESEQRFRSLADIAPVLIWINSTTGCEYANRAYLDFLGVPVERIQGMNWSEYLHPEDAQAYVESYMRALDSRGVFEAQFRFKRADGEYRWLKSLGVPRMTAEGDFLGFVGCSVDISDVKRAEEELKNADRRKDEFLAVLSHELRNPINAVVGWAQILRTGGLTPDKVLHGLDVIERNARAEAQLVESLLDLSRISTGKLDLEMKPVDLRSVATAAVENARPAARAKNIELDLRASPEPATIAGDAGRLEQVLTNVLSNAVKFTAEGGQVRVQLERAESRVVIRVVDNGAGIAPEFLPFVFERFRQADSRRERYHGGLGLGLAVVRELVQAHGGTVTADSAGTGRGSTFTITLPIRAVAGAEAARAGQAIEDLSTAINGLRILVVDDDEDARDLLAIALEGHGAAVRTAPSAAEGLRHLEQERFDVLVADIGMPEEDGYSFVTRIRNRERTESLTRLPAIAVTAYTAASDREQAFRAGFDAHLPKPVDPDALVRAVSRITPTARI